MDGRGRQNEKKTKQENKKTRRKKHDVKMKEAEVTVVSIGRMNVLTVLGRVMTKLSLASSSVRHRWSCLCAFLLYTWS